MKFIHFFVIVILLSGGITKASEGILSVNSEPSSAEVRIDDNIVGYTPLNLDLKAGSYSLDVDMIGHENFSKVITINTDDVTIENVKLKDTPNNYSHFYDPSFKEGRVFISSSLPNPISMSFLDKSYYHFQSNLFTDILLGLYRLQIGGDKAYVEIVDDELVKINYDGKKIMIQYSDESKKLLHHYLKDSSNISFVMLRDAIELVHDNHKPLLIISELNKSKFVNFLNMQDKIIQGYIKSNYIFAITDIHSDALLTINGISTPEKIIVRSIARRDDILFTTSTLSFIKSMSMGSKYDTSNFFTDAKYGVSKEKSIAVMEKIENESTFSDSISYINSVKDLNALINEKPTVIIFYARQINEKEDDKLALLNKINKTLKKEKIGIICVYITPSESYFETAFNDAGEVFKNKYKSVEEEALEYFRSLANFKIYVNTYDSDFTSSSIFPLMERYNIYTFGQLLFLNSQGIVVARNTVPERLNDSLFKKLPEIISKMKEDYSVETEAKKYPNEIEEITPQFSGIDRSTFVHPIRNKKNKIITMETNYGRMIVELYHDLSPAHADSFLARVVDGFYDSTLFHRIIPSFIIQGGGYDIYNHVKAVDYMIEAEFNDNKHYQGTLSMARANDPNSASTQFFICLERNKNTKTLDKEYTIFGQLIKGYDVLYQIGSVKTNNSGGDNSPVDPVKLFKTYISDINGSPL